ncbi:MAG: PEP-CTERM sorting domain-containing protein [Planctomycetota bacterium]
MRQYLLTASLLLSLGLAACADHAGSFVAVDQAPQPPIGPSDGNTVGSNPIADTGSAVPGNGDGFDGGGGNPPAGGGGSSGGGKGDGGGKGGGGSTGGGGSNGGAGGDSGGSPVPEPGTMLLVGTGLAGAALMRRRRQLKEELAS